jgi:hypothetical protein
MMRNPFGIVLRAPFWRVFETSIISEPLIPVTSYVLAACGTLSAFVVFSGAPTPGVFQTPGYDAQSLRDCFARAVLACV